MNGLTFLRDTCIGHKHINRFEAQTLDAIKLEISESKAEPILLNFAVFETL